MQYYVVEKKLKRNLQTPTSEYSTAEIKDYTGISGGARGASSHLDEFREETNGSIYIRSFRLDRTLSAILVTLRASLCGPPGGPTRA